MAQIILDSANNLIQGDFDAATVNNRTKLQTSTTNATTGVYVVPNGSATSASVQMANAADPTNASKIVVATNGATDTQIVSGANGIGSYLPLSFYTNNDIRFQMGNAGELNVRTAPGTVSSGTSGQFLTSGGSGAGVSWTTASGFSGLSGTAFTAPGTFTIPTGITKIKVTVVGGGGGGGNGWGGGGAVSGSTGGTSSIASGTQPIATVSATGGSGGTGAGSSTSNGSGGSGGSGSSGTLNITGGSGTPGSGSGPTLSGSQMGGVGGTDIFGANGGPAAANSGVGGGGGGAGGVAIVYLSGLTSGNTLTVTRGAGGAGSPNGSAGTDGAVLVEY